VRKEVPVMIDLSEYVKIKVNDDKMMASVMLKEPPEGESYAFEDIMGRLRTEGVTTGIKEDVVKTMAEHGIYNQRVVIANGLDPVEGRDGYYDFKFRLNPESSPKVNSDGSVNYYELALFDSVENGDLVATYHSKESGTDGYDVSGKVLSSAVKVDLPQLKGKDIRISEDGMEYYATIAGKISYSLGRIFIDTIYTVTGDVDLSTGNIDFKGDVDIMGRIASGMTVTASGNITVDGIIEGATVNAGKNILVKKGILGGNTARIHAGGNVVAQFIENTNIECDGDVQADSLINSNVKCYGSVVTHGKNGKVLGGKIKADKMVYTRYLGSTSGVKTDVQVGIDLSLIMSKKEMEAKLNGQRAELDKIEAIIEKCQKAPNSKTDMMQIIRTKIALSSEISKMTAVFDEVTKRIEKGRDSEVIVEDGVYPGVSIAIDGKILKVNESFKQIVFCRKGEQVLTRRLEDDDLEKKKI
jgi:uncharacterized protein (DUF342 family)